MRVRFSPIAPMFEELKQFTKIVVAGCQRSGTGILTRMIASDLGYLHIDETVYGTRNKPAWLDLIATKDNIVIHSPAMALYLLEVEPQSEVLFIYALRDKADVQRSMERINFEPLAKRTKAEYGKRGSKLHLYDIKYDNWNREQKPNLANWKEVEYNSLKDHPLWIDKKDRQEFTARQWK